jgi:hypothetical protein
MKTLALGDTHGTSFWKLITHIEQPDRVIFIGDYFDSFDIKLNEQLNNFLDIIQYKKDAGVEVILLIGNHDHHYFPEIGDTGTSGYQYIGGFQISPVLDANREHLQIAYAFDDFLFTHAGVSVKFMDGVFGVDGWTVNTLVNQLNELFKHKPNTFSFGMAVSMNRLSYLDPTGDNEEQSPIWIRIRSLMRANKDTELKKTYKQVIGHTQVKNIDLKGYEKQFGNKYFMIDALSTSGEYIIIEDGKITVKSIKH